MGRRRSAPWLPLACAVLLTACQPPQGDLPRQPVVLEVSRVVLPASVGREGELPVDLTVMVGGCLSFQQITAERSSHTLRLSVGGTLPAGPVACPANVAYEPHTYTNPGTPPREAPFEVFVNGKSYGTVDIR